MAAELLAAVYLSKNNFLKEAEPEASTEATSCPSEFRILDFEFRISSLGRLFLNQD
jgi:hypothetical protein